MLAKPRLNRSPPCGGLCVEEAVDHRKAPAAAGACARTTLHLSDGRQILLSDFLADRPHEHAVTRADLNLVGQTAGSRACAGLKTELLERLRDGRLAPREMKQRRISGRVSHEDSS